MPFGGLYIGFKMQLVAVLIFMVKVVRAMGLDAPETNKSSYTITITSSKILTIPGRECLHSSTPQLYLLVYLSHIHISYTDSELNLKFKILMNATILMTGF